MDATRISDSTDATRISDSMEDAAIATRQSDSSTEDAATAYQRFFFVILNERCHHPNRGHRLLAATSTPAFAAPGVPHFFISFAVVKLPPPLMS